MVSEYDLQRVHQAMRTPRKRGMVLQEDGCSIDCPTVFYDGEAGCWGMFYARFDPGSSASSGYETWLAHSENLLDWQVQGRVLAQGSGGWDDRQADGGLALINPDWDGDHTPERYDGRYWMTYIGGALPGYEPDPLSIGVAYSETLSPVRPWQRPLTGPVLSPSDPDVRPFEAVTLYKSAVVRDPDERLGHPFLMYYNGKRQPFSIERIGLAVSDDMLHWRRCGDGHLLDQGIEDRWNISGDPQLIRWGDLWVMHFFVARDRTAYDTFACSRDLLNWTPWTGEPLVKPDQPYDMTFAHKPFVLKHDDVVYHFYCAVGDRGRGIALATSR
ncbi:MAG: hypothetical protein PHG76_08015 [Eubacteriales bacterium]|nr:hypothetical protein [Eubacteriales bacterium]